MESSQIYLAFLESKKRMKSSNINLIIHKNNKNMLAPFYILNYNVNVAKNMCIDFFQVQSIMDHEIGHTVYCPITLKKHIQMVDYIERIMKIQKQNANFLLNLAGDMIVDYSIKKYNNSPLSHRCEIDKQQVQKNTNFSFMVLEEYYNIICQKKIFEVKDLKAKKCAKKCYDIVISNLIMENKVYEIVKFFENEIKKQEKNEQDFNNFLKNYTKITNTNKNFSSTQDSRQSKNKQDLKNKIADEMLNKKQSSGYSKNEKCMGIEIPEKELIKSKARRNIKIKGLNLSNRSGKIATCGYENWFLNDNSEHLDILESINNNGILIPEITTIKKSSKIGYDEISIGCPPMMLCIDTSGSMSYQNALISLCSFVEAARFYKVKVGLILFHTQVYLSEKPTYDYDKLIDKAFEKFESGGTTIINVIKKLREVSKNNFLNIMVTDWEDCNPKNLAQSFSSINGVSNITINFGRDSMSKYLKEIKINNLNELENSLIDLVNNVIKGGLN